MPPSLPDTVSVAAEEPARRSPLGVVVGLVVLVGTAALVMIPLRSASAPAAAPAPPAVVAADQPSTQPAVEPDAAPEFVPPVVGVLTPRPAAPSAVVVAPTRTTSLEDLIGRVLPAVVTVDSSTGRGTGFYIGPDRVITNHHVVEGQSSVTLISGGVKRTARVMGIASGTDLAVLQVYNADPKQATLELGSVSRVRVGEEVIAVGSPLGVLSNTVTRGIVSAVRRAGDLMLIQTDAAINPGNSGGPLVNRAGLVIGINSMTFAKQVAESLSFAIAVDHVQPLLNGQTSLAARAPVETFANAMRGGPSEGEQQRRQGEAQYEAVLKWATRYADQVDQYWNRYSKTCVSNSRRSGDRAWFAVYEPQGVVISATSAYDCEQFLDNLSANARQMKDQMDQAGDAARRTGVYPGVLRDLRRRYRLDWAGWER
jgi:putative serine protease PepD